MFGGKTRPSLCLKIWNHRSMWFQALQQHCSRQSPNSHFPPPCHFRFFFPACYVGPVHGACAATWTRQGKCLAQGEKSQPPERLQPAGCFFPPAWGQTRTGRYRAEKGQKKLPKFPVLSLLLTNSHAQETCTFKTAFCILHITHDKHWGATTCWAKQMPSFSYLGRDAEALSKARREAYA